MFWHFHTIVVEGITGDAALRARWQQTFASRPVTAPPAALQCRLDLVARVPAPPPGEPQFRQGELLAYYLDGPLAVAHFPRFGQLRLDLSAGTTTGQLVPTALDTYGVFEDLVAIGLSPHLRRNGMFLIHAFAAAYRGRAALLVGEIGAGKTTTGMALLDAGWQLLSNDSPIIGANGMVLSYPGLLAAYPTTFARFDTTAHLAPAKTPQVEDHHKLSIAAEDIWPGVWREQAPLGALFFPQIEDRARTSDRAPHTLTPLAPPEALRRLLPHAVEQWDREMMPGHLRILRQLAEAAPAFVLHLGPDVQAIPALLAGALTDHSL